MPAAGTTEHAPYTILDLGTGSGNWSSAYDINERGDVLWTWATSQDPHVGPVQRWPQRCCGPMARPPISRIVASTSRERSMTAGPSWEARTWQDRRPQRALSTDSGTVTPIDPFDGGSVVDINNAGDMLGWMDGTAVIASDGTDHDHPCSLRIPTRASRSRSTSRAAGGQGLGEPHRRMNQRAVLLTDGIVTVLEPAPGAQSSSADDLNDVGQLVGAPASGGVACHPPGRPGVSL